MDEGTAYFAAQDLEGIREQEADERFYNRRRSLKSLSSSIRRSRSDEYKRFNSPPKIRGKIAVDKIR